MQNTGLVFEEIRRSDNSGRRDREPQTCAVNAVVFLCLCIAVG